MTEREQWEKEKWDMIQEYEKYVEEHIEAKQVTPEMVKDLRDRGIADPEKVAEFCLAVWKISRRLNGDGGWEWDKDLTVVMNEHKRLYWKQCPLVCGWKGDEKEKDDD